MHCHAYSLDSREDDKTCQSNLEEKEKDLFFPSLRSGKSDGKKGGYPYYLHKENEKRLKMQALKAYIYALKKKRTDLHREKRERN